MNKLLMAASAMALSVAIAPAAYARDDSAKFAKEAAEGGKAEVELGKLVSEKGTNADVKKFAQMMVDDHSKANSELEQLASKKSIALPQDLARKHKASYDKLSKASGGKLDKDYMKDMVKDHEEDVKAFKKQAQEGSDPEMAAFAKKTLPVLENHLQVAKTIDGKLK